MVKEITFLRRILCICKCFIDVQFILVSMLKKKLQNVPRLEMTCMILC